MIIEAGAALGRRLIVVDTPLKAVRKLNTRNFGKVFLAAFMLDAIDWQTVEMREALTHLFYKGSKCFIFHGNRAEEAELLADRIIVDKLGDRENSNNVIFTVSRPDQSISEFVDLVTISTCLAEDYIEDWASDVFFCVAGTEQARDMAEMLR